MAEAIISSSFYRIDDDLCQHIFSFLAFEDKLKMESVSQQFQRNVFEKQLDLTISSSVIGASNLNVLAKTHPSIEAQELKVMDLEALKSVLKKCQNINRIVILNFEFVNKKEVLRVIAKYATNLTKLTMDKVIWNRRLFSPFLQKLGQNLRLFELMHFDTKDLKTVFHLCPNISIIQRYLNLSDIFDENNLLVRRVREIRINFHRKDIKLFTRFVESNKWSIRWLSVDFNTFDGPTLHEFESQLIRLHNLQILHIVVRSVSLRSAPLFESLLKLLATNCKRLGNLTLNLRVESIEGYSLIMNSLNSFSEVRRIAVNITPPLFVLTPMFSTNFNNCRNLTHLSLNNTNLSEQFLEEIGTHLPKLIHLEIDGFHTLTDLAIDSISRLKKIETIKLGHFGTNQLTQTALNNLYNKCQQLKLIRFIEKVPQFPDYDSDETDNSDDP